MKISENDMHSICDRYISAYKAKSTSNYTNIRNNFTKLFLYKFFNRFEKRLNWIDETIRDSIISELNYNIYKTQLWSFHLNIQDKINWETRKSCIPPIYSLIYYEFLSEKVFFLIKHITRVNEDFGFLIDNSFFWYSNQYQINDTGNVIKKWYSDLWCRFKWSHKKIKKTSLRFVLKADIKDFYDSINHNCFLEELKIFVNNNIFFDNFDSERDFLKTNFDFIWDGKSDFEKTFEILLYELSSILLKVNQHQNIWMPQNIIASDFLSSLYIFMKVYNNLEELWLKTHNTDDWNLFYKYTKNQNEVFFNNYSDDFLLITNDYIFWKKFLNDWLINLFSRDWIKFNSMKTKIENYEDYLINDFLSLDFSMLFKNNVQEIKEYKELLLINIKEQNINKTKTLIKLFYLISLDDYLNNEILNELEKYIEIWNLKNFWKKNIDNNKNIEFVLNLVRFSPKFAIQLYIMMEETDTPRRYLEKYYKFIENFFPMLAINTLGVIKLRLNYDLKYWYSRHFIEKITESIKTKQVSNFYIDKLLNREEYFSKDSLILSDYKWLVNFLFKDDYNKWEIRENNIWLMLKGLFWVNSSISQKLNDLYKGKKERLPVYLNWLLWKLSFILEEMLKEKEKNNLFYLNSPNFIADLHSLFNNLFSIIVSLQKGELYVCDVWRGKNVLNLENHSWAKEKMFLKKDLMFNEDEINLFHFIKKKRAYYVHKERDSDNNELLKKSFDKFNNIGILSWWISKNLLKMFDSIDKEI